MSTIMQLQPGSYNYLSDQFPTLNLPSEEQLGFVAQDLELVLPQLVKDVHIPASLDSTGVQLSPAMDIKAINYVGMIPLLLAALQEQQTLLTQLQQQLIACCAMDSDDTAPKSDGMAAGSVEVGAREQLLSINPNPFTDHTTVSYTLERAGRAMLLVNSSDGKQLQVLNEAVLEHGDYRYEWSTGHLAPGIYYVTLLLDGEPLVKRAVKVGG